MRSRNVLVSHRSPRICSSCCYQPCCDALWRNRKGAVSVNSRHMSSLFAASHLIWKMRFRLVFRESTLCRIIQKKPHHKRANVSLMQGLLNVFGGVFVNQFYLFISFCVLVFPSLFSNPQNAHKERMTSPQEEFVFELLHQSKHVVVSGKVAWSTKNWTPDV